MQHELLIAAMQQHYSFNGPLILGTIIIGELLFAGVIYFAGKYGFKSDN